MGLQDVDDAKIKERELKVMRNLAPGDFAAVKKRLTILVRMQQQIRLSRV